MTRDSSGVNRRSFLAGCTAGVGAAAVLGAVGDTPAFADARGTADAQGSAGARTATPASAVTAADQQYPDLVRALNARYVAAPDLVEVVDTPSQIPAIVASAVKAGKQLSVRSGGHCLEDFVYNPDVKVVIDLTNMNHICYDSTYNAISVESGATLLDVYTKLYQTWGITLPGGICYSVGMGGHVSGGGWGWLTRRNGLIVDHLHGVEVVLVDATGSVRTVVATRDPADPNRDLWWAHTGGGGGNFGVVTRYLFRSPGVTSTDPRKLLPPPPAQVLFNVIGWAWDELTEDEFVRLVHNYSQWHADNISPTSPTRFLASFLVMNHASNGQIGLLTQVDAGAPNAEQILDDYLAFINDGVSTQAGAVSRRMGDFAALPEAVTPLRLPWLQATRMTSTTNPLLNDPTLRAEYKSAYVKTAFRPEQAQAMYRQLTRTDIHNPDISIQLTSYGGVASGVAADATAAPHRSAAFKMLWSVQWNDPADDATYIGWARDSYRDVWAATGGVPVPDDVTDGCYVNYADADLSDPAFNTSGVPWSTLYYKDAYPRLQRIKKKYDPRNVFRHRQSIELPS
ncbi:FAD-binding protein [Actinacidiphila sp. DG2A-62]|uniref:FAD-binding oxidoreductase n=1 Tax=Actinacidiphila sp. DG2A-62 TaxID=3108821 RepID=UPI002DB96590|nr:FAD-binding protein [Actinacidiphila sp. DG2A-62]MEC3994866.1 FAD-binding protein [Actinacidiphila sp. DG2A-62]